MAARDWMESIRRMLDKDYAAPEQLQRDLIHITRPAPSGHKVGCKCVDCLSGKTQPGLTDAEVRKAAEMEHYLKKIENMMIYYGLNPPAIVPSLPLHAAIGAIERHPEMKEEFMLQNKLAHAAKAKGSKPSKRQYEIAEKLIADGLDKQLVEAADAFESDLIRYVALGGKIKALEAKREILKTRIAEVVEGAGYKTLIAGEHQATYVDGATRTKLDPKLLVTQGVPVHIIEKATVVTKTKPYVTVTEVTNSREDVNGKPKTK